MPIELAEVVAGFPLAASFAIAGGLTALREGRRRASLNEAVHELRRPLQVLSLSLPANSATTRSLESSLQITAAAVDRLEREINGQIAPAIVESVPVRGLVEAAVGRWRPLAALAGRCLTLHWRAGDPHLHGYKSELDQGLDNLISNGFEHGQGEVAVEVREVGRLLLVTVRDSGSLVSPRRRPNGRRVWSRFRGRNRHGHGLQVVRRVASRHGGVFHLCRSPGGTEARLELPLGGAAR